MTQQVPSVAATAPRNFSNTPEKSRAHVLVVDDERLVRWAVAETLGARGYDVSEAGDAQSALAALRVLGRSTDLVLLDLFLPDACDLGVLNFIRTCAPAIPVIMMTAFATRDIIEQALSLGALVMTKPFDMNELAAAVDRALVTPLS
jgi:DNA-binding NtrC family response regulator